MGLIDRDYMRAEPYSNGRPRVTLPMSAVSLLMAINIAVFVLQHFFNLAVDERLGIPWGALSLPALLEGRVWTLVTHLFVHGSLGHIFANMLMLYMAGKALESLIGTQKFLGLYFLSGFVAAVFEFGVHRIAGHDFSNFVMYGASGATCGVFFGAAAILPQQQVTAMIYFIIPVRMKLWTMARLLMGTSVIFGLMNLTGHDVDNIAHFAHLGGALAGWWFVKMYAYQSRYAVYEDMLRKTQERESYPEYAGIARRRRAADVDDQHNSLSSVRKTRELIEQEIDPILEKIHAQGINSLTDAEREVLLRARQEMLDDERGGS